MKEMTRSRLMLILMLVFIAPAVGRSADHLSLNPNLNYQKNGHQGPLIFGKHMEEGTKPGMVNYIVFYAEFCYNAKRQAKTTVDLYNKYHERVHFVVIDFEYGWSWVQNKLVMKYFARNIPQIVILDSKGRPVFNYVGESPESTLDHWLNAALDYPNRLAEVDQPMDHPGETYTDEITHNPLVIMKDHLTR
jgi:hypothetical protein